MLKGWLERVMVPGVAFVFDDAAARCSPACSTCAASSASAPTDRRGRYVKLINDNGRRMLMRALRMSAGGARDDVARAVLHRHHRDQRATAVPRPGRARRWRRLGDERRSSSTAIPIRSRSRGGPRRRCRARSTAGGHDVRVPTSTPRDSIRASAPRNDAPTSSPGPHASLQRYADELRWCEHARARLPDVVERAAGDAQGLDRPGLGRRRRVGAAAPASNRVTAAADATSAGSPWSPRTGRRSWSTRSRARAASAPSPASCARCASRAAATTWIAMYGVDTLDRRATRRARSSIASNGGWRAVDRRRGRRSTRRRARRRSRRRPRRCSRRGPGWPGRSGPRSPRRCGRARTA